MTNRLEIWGLEFDAKAGSMYMFLASPNNLSVNAYNFIVEKIGKFRFRYEGGLEIEAFKDEKNEDILSVNKIYVVTAYNDSHGKLCLAYTKRVGRNFVNVFGANYLYGSFKTIDGERLTQTKDLAIYTCPQMHPSI